MINNEPSANSSSPHHRLLDQKAVVEFLKSGWMLSSGAQNLPAGEDQILLGWGTNRSISGPSNRASSCAWYAPDFYLQSRTPWHESSHWILTTRAHLTHLIAGLGAQEGFAVQPKAERFRWLGPELSEFEEKIREIRSGMKSRALEKAVPVAFETAQGLIDSARRLAILEQLLKLPSSLYLYGCWDGEKNGMMGATPELLFETETTAQGDTLSTVALAGTRGKVAGEDTGRLLLDDPKERHEHQLVIDDLSERLSSLGELSLGSTAAVEVPTLFHLKTPLQARFKTDHDRRRTVEDFAKMLHPTPALGVAPRRLGFAEMRRWDEPARRKRFGAPFGVNAVLPDGQIICRAVVAIRNIQWQDDELLLGSGCGVVAASETAREWNELRLKREAVKAMLGV